MVMDGELIPSSGAEFVREYAHLPILTGIASREWAHKKRKSVPTCSQFSFVAEFYEFYRFENLSRAIVESAVRKLIVNSYIPRLSHKISNTTINLISNATFLRYVRLPA